MSEPHGEQRRPPAHESAETLISTPKSSVWQGLLGSAWVVASSIMLEVVAKLLEGAVGENEVVTRVVGAARWIVVLVVVLAAGYLVWRRVFEMRERVRRGRELDMTATLVEPAAPVPLLLAPTGFRAPEQRPPLRPEDLVVATALRELSLPDYESAALYDVVSAMLSAADLLPQQRHPEEHRPTADAVIRRLMAHRVLVHCADDRFANTRRRAEPAAPHETRRTADVFRITGIPAPDAASEPTATPENTAALRLWQRAARQVMAPALLRHYADRVQRWAIALDSTRLGPGARRWFTDEWPRLAELVRACAPESPADPDHERESRADLDPEGESPADPDRERESAAEPEPGPEPEAAHASPPETAYMREPMPSPEPGHESAGQEPAPSATSTLTADTAQPVPRLPEDLRDTIDIRALARIADALDLWFADNGWPENTDGIAAAMRNLLDSPLGDRYPELRAQSRIRAGAPGRRVRRYHPRRYSTTLQARRAHRLALHRLQKPEIPELPETPDHTEFLPTSPHPPRTDNPLANEQSPTGKHPSADAHTPTDTPPPGPHSFSSAQTPTDADPPTSTQASTDPQSPMSTQSSTGTAASIRTESPPGTQVSNDPQLSTSPQLSTVPQPPTDVRSQTGTQPLPGTHSSTGTQSEAGARLPSGMELPIDAQSATGGQPSTSAIGVRWRRGVAWLARVWGKGDVGEELSLGERRERARREDLDEVVDQLEKAWWWLPRADVAGEVCALIDLAVVHLQQGRLVAARNRLELAESLTRGGRDLSGRAHTFELMGVLWWVRGEPRRALRFWQVALTRYNELDHRLGTARCLQHLGSAMTVAPEYGSLLLDGEIDTSEVLRQASGWLAEAGARHPDALFAHRYRTAVCEQLRACDLAPLDRAERWPLPVADGGDAAVALA
ncbi:hypothetical protein [Nocardia wallacei]|uniref:hypothetical protein n=1 Tax=Nocardia wallacei TaxID=480035 RepID=UPI00245458BD|nr:hypothetical protein [Nocardia wallacei]